MANEINATKSDYAHNLQVLLKSDSCSFRAQNGRLCVLETPDRPKRGITGLIFESPEVVEVSKVVNETCRRFLNETLFHYPEPLTSVSKSLNREREKARRLLQITSGSNVLASPLKDDLKEFADQPETLEARLALRMGIAPRPLNQTSSGTYIMYNRFGEEWGIFKPKQQELGGNKNPNWTVWTNHSAEEFGIPSCTGYLREWVAYLLDKKENPSSKKSLRERITDFFDTDNSAGVPYTCITSFSHPALDTSIIKLSTPNLQGSFQFFKPGCKSGSEVLQKYEFYEIKNPKNGRFLSKVARQVYFLWMRIKFNFCPHIPTHEIHKMGVFDIRFLNCDRHTGNFLMDKNSKLYPIDHGLTLPLDANFLRFDWKDLIQAHYPFSSSMLRYIAKLDPERDAEILREHGITEPAIIERMKLATLLLKKCAAHKMTLHQIADLMIGTNAPSSPSELAKRNTYFEREICRIVLDDKNKDKPSPEILLESAIANYKKQHGLEQPGMLSKFWGRANFTFEESK